MTLLVLYQMLKRIPAMIDWAARWQVRLRQLSAKLPTTPLTPRPGFTDAWFANPIWL